MHPKKRARLLVEDPETYFRLYPARQLRDMERPSSPEEVRLFRRRRNKGSFL